MTRAILTDDGYLFLEVSPDVWSDGDMTVTRFQLSWDAGGYRMISDIDAHPEHTARVARIRSR